MDGTTKWSSLCTALSQVIVWDALMAAMHMFQTRALYNFGWYCWLQVHCKRGRWLRTIPTLQVQVQVHLLWSNLWGKPPNFADIMCETSPFESVALVSLLIMVDMPLRRTVYTLKSCKLSWLTSWDKYPCHLQSGWSHTRLTPPEQGNGLLFLSIFKTVHLPVRAKSQTDKPHMVATFPQ